MINVYLCTIITKNKFMKMEKCARHNYTYILLRVLFVILFSTISAHIINAQEIDGINYVITNDGQGVGVDRNTSHKYAGDVVIPASVKIDGIDYPVIQIHAHAFYGCLDLKSVTIGDNVKWIGMSCFEDCKNLKTVVWGKSIEKLFDYVFKGCESLTTLRFPESLKSIRYESCYGCTKLDTLDLGDGLETIGYNCFGQCSTIKHVFWGKGIKEVDFEAFSSISNANVYVKDLKSWFEVVFKGYNSNPLGSYGTFYLDGERIDDLIIPEGVEKINDFAFISSPIRSVRFPNSVTSIGKCAFDGCWKLKEITLSNSIISIGNSAFSGCGELTKLDLGNCLKEIDEFAFDFCQKLETLIIPNSVNTIGNYAFAECSNLKTIIIGSGITNLGLDAFKFYYPNIKDVYCYASQVPNVVVGNDLPSNSPYSATLHVPQSSLSEYKETKPWKYFKRIVALQNKDPQPTNIESIENPSQNNAIYDLRGRRVVNPQNGIYIINGKKRYINNGDKSFK